MAGWRSELAGCRSTLSMLKIKVRISETKFRSFYKTLIPILFSSLSRNTKHSISSLETQFVGFIELKLWQTVLGRTKKLKIILIARILSEKGGNSSVALFLSNWCPFTKYIMIFSSLCSITFYVAAESNSNEYLYNKIKGSTVTVWLAQFF